MLSSIHPLGERARRQRWGYTAAAYAVGSVVGGLGVGLVAGTLGAAVRWAGVTSAGAAGLAAGLALGAAALETGRPATALPGPRRQVNEDWLTEYRGWVYGTGFGVQLGFGVATIVTTATVYLALALAALSGSVAAGAAVGATFGLARALPVLGMRRVESPEQLRAVHRRLTATASRARSVSAVAVAGVGVLLAVGAFAGA